MIQSFKIINNIGEDITMEIGKPETTGFLISSVTGLSHPKSEISSNEIALFDGATVTNTRVPSRNIVIDIIFYSNDNNETIEELRHKCYRYFPVKQEITIYVTNDSGTYWIKGYVESNETNIFSKTESVQISIICPDPYFVKNDSNNEVYVSSIVPNFHFPTSFEFSGDTIPVGYTKFNGSYIVIPNRSDQVIDLANKAVFGNFIITKVSGVQKNNGLGKGSTLIIGGAKTPDQPDYVDESDFIWSFDYYPGAPILRVPEKNEQYIDTKGYCFSSLGISGFNITVKRIPNKVITNGINKGSTLYVLGREAENELNPV